jgi:predicted mannosyl-3-phosphoglycerate phosphatase (HAD superfamily)
MLRRALTVYVSVDSFLSPRGKVLHHFGQFLAGLEAEQIPCVWISGCTRAQLDEPRRRLRQNAPYIGENGCGVYLPEDYFHLKGSRTVRMGRYTCIPVAKPQPAAAAALDEISADLKISVVPLSKLSRRELCQNTGLPGNEAELMRMRDFDELFFFAGASDAEISRFETEAKARGLRVQSAGAFWSLSCGGDLAKCVRELGGLYDRALRSHVLRIGVGMALGDGWGRAAPGGYERWPSSVFDRVLWLTERSEPSKVPAVQAHPRSEPAADIAGTGAAARPARESGFPGEFHLASPTVWDDMLACVDRSAAPRRTTLR